IYSIVIFKSPRFLHLSSKRRLLILNSQLLKWKENIQVKYSSSYINLQFEYQMV
ncbi:hypothetical protein CMV_027442, partial [Castanea mollissima]